MQETNQPQVAKMTLTGLEKAELVAWAVAMLVVLTLVWTLTGCGTNKAKCIPLVLSGEFSGGEDSGLTNLDFSHYVPACVLPAHQGPWTPVGYHTVRENMRDGKGRYTGRTEICYMTNWICAGGHELITCSVTSMVSKIIVHDSKLKLPPLPASP